MSNQLDAMFIIEHGISSPDSCGKSSAMCIRCDSAADPTAVIVGSLIHIYPSYSVKGWNMKNTVYTLTDLLVIDENSINNLSFI